MFPVKINHGGGGFFNRAACHIDHRPIMTTAEPAGISNLLSNRRFAQTYNIILILKGAYTAMALPDGNCWFNSTGNPGMGTAGSGDVLTGILTGLIAQGYQPNEAALLGVYLHGLSGDIALAGSSE